MIRIAKAAALAATKPVGANAAGDWHKSTLLNVAAERIVDCLAAVRNRYRRFARRRRPACSARGDSDGGRPSRYQRLVSLREYCVPDGLYGCGVENAGRDARLHGAVIRDANDASAAGRNPSLWPVVWGPPHTSDSVNIFPYLCRSSWPPGNLHR